MQRLRSPPPLTELLQTHKMTTFVGIGGFFCDALTARCLVTNNQIMRTNVEKSQDMKCLWVKHALHII